MDLNKLIGKASHFGLVTMKCRFLVSLGMTFTQVEFFLGERFSEVSGQV